MADNLCTYLPVITIFLRRVGTLFCTSPDMFGASDDEDGADNYIARQAEGARTGGRQLCALNRSEGVC